MAPRPRGPGSPGTRWYHLPNPEMCWDPDPSTQKTAGIHWDPAKTHQLLKKKAKRPTLWWTDIPEQRGQGHLAQGARAYPVRFVLAWSDRGEMTSSASSARAASEEEGWWREEELDTHCVDRYGDLAGEHGAGLGTLTACLHTCQCTGSPRYRSPARRTSLSPIEAEGRHEYTHAYRHACGHAYGHASRHASRHACSVMGLSRVPDRTDLARGTNT